MRDKDWNLLPIEEILADVEKARRKVIEVASGIDPQDWVREIADGVDVYQFLLTVSHDDADTLRSVAQRLYRDQ